MEAQMIKFNSRQAGIEFVVVVVVIDIAVVLAFLVVLATVAGQALKAAQSNPIESIRTE
jgi:ABC-type antimicrobial peptide transport system permease subunit|tara:strand:- start:110285 stop:110461 length:177 start_codon:yes stop_codon:yes gene_type:complete